MKFEAQLSAEQFAWLQQAHTATLARVDLLTQQVKRLMDFLDRVQVAAPKDPK